MSTRSSQSTRFIFRRGAALAGGIVAIGLAATFAWRDEAPAAPASAPTLQFTAQEVVTASVGPVGRVLEFSGPLVAPATAVVKTDVAATLLALQVNEGARVRAGQVVGRLDLADLHTEIDHRRAAVALARATLDEVTSHHKANETLAERQFISSTALRASRGKLEVAQAQLDAARAQLATAQVNERQAALVAPIDGIIARRHAVPGENLSAHQTIFTIVDLATLELAGTVPAHEAAQLRAGQRVSLTVDGAGEALAGHIQRIAPHAEPGTRGIGVTVVLPNADERYRAGQYAQARLEIADPQPRMTLPATAVLRSAGQEYVWVIEHGKLVRRAIITGSGLAGTGRVIVLNGLAPQAQVLAVRFDNLREGTAARLAGTAAAQASTTAAR
ncbi:RND family efflux transporter MFP subunit [Pseudoduganella flava]|uniref:Efflux RND transporter periplasmic adaptor subunit n=1 Tax=Pseudoduganella flava TaxID=871742 RepID=A0A562PHQ6_9BURK|nr:efflux RND transporter periplasmic adaptor subunit [Pseudoduganella flava]QGZ37679.1 efflux RND transporter periplasmic adaptor subunit [Pseudoduganella flava]TWI43957.1 RND family efflux transporter MFP subunit [Pseudoduganella flava]